MTAKANQTAQQHEAALPSIETLFGLAPCTEATSWRAAIRTAEGVVRDVGPEAAAKSGGLTELSRCALSNSERDCQNVVETFKLALPIPFTNLPKTLGVRYSGDFQALKLESWCEFMVAHNCWHIMCGLAKPDHPRECAILSEFWKRFRALYPNHQLWASNLDWSRTAPLLLHGDEGRGRKKAPFLVCSWRSALGLGTDAANKSRKHKPYLSMKLNYAGNAYKHRFVTAVLPKMFRDEQALKGILEFITRDGLRMVQTGVTDKSGNRFYAACINVVGDWAWLAKCGNLARSYHNIEKRPRGANANPRGICHLCCAGQLPFPFEDLRLHSVPAWRRTRFSEDAFTTPPALARLPHVPGQTAGLFAFDLWHAYYLGVAKSFLAGCLALLSDAMLDGRGAIDARFSQISDMYLAYCEASGSLPYLTTISKDTIGWPDRGTYPNGMWSKGHVSTSISNFFQDFCSKHDVAGMNNGDYLVLCGECNGWMNSCMDSLYRSDVWLLANDAKQIAMNALRFLDGYMRLARKAYDDGKHLFPFMPKAHALHEVFYTLHDEATSGVAYALNPLIRAVQVDEDYIGKTSRLARRTGAPQVITRVLQRGLQASFAHWYEAGYIRS